MVDIAEKNLGETSDCGDERSKKSLAHARGSNEPATSEEAAAADQPLAPYSVRQAFRGKTVLLTGTTGFVGSVVLEQLLR